MNVMVTNTPKRDLSKLTSLDDWLEEEGIVEEVTASAQTKIDNLITKPHAKVVELSVGDIVKVDPDYLLGDPDEQYEVKQDDKGLFIVSSEDNYYLEPFIRGGGEYYLGIYLVDCKNQ
jgi:hypothetical protein